MGTAERRLEMMKLLCKRRHETMPNLAKEFGVSIRTIQRDILELTFLMPIYVKTGRHEGGVYVDEGYTMDRMYMSTEHIQLLLKVQTLVGDQLNSDERFSFERIIKNYTKPS